MTTTHNTRQKRIAQNVKNLGELLNTNLSAGELYAIHTQLEGYSKIVLGLAMLAEENS